MIKLTQIISFKPIDKHQYLSFTSSHPNRSIVYSQGYKLKRYVLKKKNF